MVIFPCLLNDGNSCILSVEGWGQRLVSGCDAAQKGWK